MKYDAVIFDLDGTILATLDDLANSVNYSLRINDLPERSKIEIRRFVGNGIRNLIERSVPEDCNKTLTDKVFEDFKGYYKKHSTDKTKPYDGVLEMLKRLKDAGIKIAVLSNKADYAVQELCARYFDGFIDAVAGEISNVPRKPAPDGVYRIAELMKTECKRCVYVGDSEVDVVTAANANIDCIAVDWGFRDVNELKAAGAAVIVSSTEELFEKITAK